MEATACLSEAGVDSAARDSRALMAAALEVTADRVMLIAEDPMPVSALRRFKMFIRQRIARKPVSRILSRRLFWGREFLVSPHVLDPRPETEILIATALREGPRHRILDLGTGSGIIAVSLLTEWRDAVALATDISPQALETAYANAFNAGVERRLRTLRSDWFEWVTGSFDIIVSNPPYVTATEFDTLEPEVRLYDPAIALTDGADGLSAFKSIRTDLTRYLEPGGFVLVEIGPSQGAAMSRMFMETGLIDVTVHKDFDGRDRVVSGKMML